MKTLMIHTGGIGDFLLTCPTIKALSMHERIFLVGYPDRLQLAVDAGIAEEVHSLDDIGFDSVFSKPNAQLEKAVSGKDRIIVWMNDSDHCIKQGLRTISQAEVLIRSPLPPEDSAQHASDYFSDCLGLPQQRPFRWTPKPSYYTLDIVIHPGSGDLKKNWSLDHFEVLAQQLKEAGRRVNWCIGPAEIDGMSRLPMGSLLQCESLSELASALATAQHFIGNDSGITHLAGTLGIPTIALFNHTNPKVWAPQGENVSVLVQNGLDVERLLEYF